jgi:hypothetical protein
MYMEPSINIGRAASWAWIASSLRLNQNLADVAMFSRVLQVDLQAYWDTYKSVLQVRPRLAHVTRRVSTKLFYEHLYEMKPFLEMEQPGNHLDANEDGDGVLSVVLSTLCGSHHEVLLLFCMCAFLNLGHQKLGSKNGC